MYAKIKTLLLVLLTANVHAQINNSSFSVKTDFVSGGGSNSNPSGIKATDLDNDNKKDIIVGNVGNGTISIFRNITTGDSITLAPKIDFASSNPVNFIATADLDGDGKTDVLASSNSGTSFSIFRNTTSAVGTITFATRINISTITGPYNFDIADVDGDLKPDLICINYNSGSFSIFRNTSTIGSISFAVRIDITCGGFPSSIVAYDMDGDNKNDIAVTLYTTSLVAIYRNTTSIIGSPTFSFVTNISTGSYPHFIQSGDIDNDGKRDLVTGNFFGNNISVIKNTSSIINSISFQTAQNFSSGSGASNCQGISITDFDNDNKLDIGVCNYGSNNITVFKNISTVGFINSSSLAAQVNFAANTNPTFLFASDLNADSKPDIIVSNYASGNISIYRNQILATEPTVAASNLTFSNYFANSITLNFTKGNGARRMVLARAGSAVNANPVDTFGYTANGAFGNGSQIGTGNFVVYADTGSTITVSGLAPGTYHFTVIEYNGTGTYSNYLPSPALTGNVNLGKVYFSKSTGNLNDLSNWGINPDGTGTAPTVFSDTNTVYFVVNNASPAFNANWFVSGNNSFVVFGDGSIVYNLNIPSIYTISVDSIVVKNNITLSIQGSLGVNKSFWETGSTALYYGSTAQTLVSGSYNNLQVISGSKNINGNITVRNTLTMTASINTNSFIVTLGTSAANTGTLSRSGGTINGRFRRWFATSTNAGVTGLFPIGTSTNYRPLSIEYTGAPTTGGTYMAEFISTNPGTVGLPVFDNPVFISTAGTNGFWRITNNGIIGGAFTGTATATGFFSVNDYTQVKMLCRTATNWSIPGTSLTTLGSNAAAVIARSGLSTNTWEFGVGGDPSTNPLPVKLISATAKYLNEEVVINWQTASEENNSHFEIEKLVNHNWTFVAKINGAGNTNKISNYLFVDKYLANNLAEDKIYYRLKQVDFSGEINYSEVLFVEISSLNYGLNLSPVPLHEVMSVTSAGDEIIEQIELYDINGKLLFIESEQSTINVEALQKGIYIVRVLTSKQTHIQKVIK